METKQNLQDDRSIEKGDSLNFGLLHGFLNFQNTSNKVFALPFGMMSSTLYDIATIMGFLIDGDEIPFLHNLVSNDLGFQVNKKNSAYSTFITSFNNGSDPVEDIEHKAFLLSQIY